MLTQSGTLVKYNNAKLQPTKDSISIIRTSDQKKSKDGELFNQILPPQKSIQNGNHIIREVSSLPASKNNVIELQEELDRRLEQLQIRETGFCPIRERLYQECFDEIIRQIAIECGPRGQLLSNVRDEIKMVIKSYQTLYISNLGYGMRKYLLVDQEKSMMEERINELERECEELETDVKKMESENLELQKTFDNQRRENESKHKSEMSVEKAKMVVLHSETLKILDLISEKEKAAKAAKAKAKKENDD